MPNKYGYGRAPAEIRAKIAEILDDDRFAKAHGGRSARTATVFENAPLALEQLAMEVKVDALRWVLGERKYL